MIYLSEVAIGKMGRIIIRCDASLKIGSGHVIRCRTLARDLAKKGSEVIFVCRNQPGDLINLLEKEFHVLQLRKQSSIDCSNLSGPALYRGWLGCSEIDDALETIEAIKQANIYNIEWIVVDHYSLEEAWEKYVSNHIPQKSIPQILVIDDLANRPHHASLIVDQNFFGKDTEHRYNQLVSSSCIKLLGPKYCIIGSEYSELRQLLPPRSDVKRMLIYFGGVDNCGLNQRVLSTLEDSIPGPVGIDIVLGVQAGNIEINSKSHKNGSKIAIHKPMNSLAGLIARADLSIGAGGATTWERACLGLPSIVIPLSENQIEFNQALHESKYISLVSYNDSRFEDNILDEVKMMMTNPDLVRERSIRLAQLVDGNGKDRIIHIMKNF